MSAFGIGQAFQSWYGILIMGLLGGLSVYLVALILVRFKFFRRVQIDSQALLRTVARAIAANDQGKINEIRGQRVSDPPVKILVSTGLCNSDLSLNELADLFVVTRIRQRDRLTKGLSVFGTVATISPFIGLLGTVMGIVESFNNLAATGAAGPNVVASGVAAALWTTAAGLVVAIPAVVAYNVFKNKAKSLMTDLEVASRELLIIFKNENFKKVKPVPIREG